VFPTKGLFSLFLKASLPVRRDIGLVKKKKKRPYQKKRPKGTPHKGNTLNVTRKYRYIAGYN